MSEVKEKFKAFFEVDSLRDLLKEQDELIDMYIESDIEKSSGEW